MDFILNIIELLFAFLLCTGKKIIYKDGNKWFQPLFGAFQSNLSISTLTTKNDASVNLLLLSLILVTRVDTGWCVDELQTEKYIKKNLIKSKLKF